MRINNMNAGSVPANTQGTEAQKGKNTDVLRVERKPTERTTSGGNNIKKPNEENVKEVMNDDMLQKSVDQANKSLEMYNRKIEREVHEVTHTVMYTVRDTITNEVIQEFPPRKIQDMIAKMWELAGLFVDERA